MAPQEPVAVEPLPPEPEPAAMEVAEEPGLLGPPEMADPTVAISPDTGWPVITVAAALEPGTAGPVVEPLPMEPAMREPGMMVATGEPAPSWANVAQYEVKRGDTLWEIADEIRADRSLTIEQVVMALYEANRDAFFENNVNNVWAGEILMIPEREEVAALPERQARKVFFAQYDEWQEYKLKLASASRTIKVADASTDTTAPAAESARVPVTERPEITQQASEQVMPKVEEAQVAAKPTEAEQQPAVEQAPKPQAEEKPKDSTGAAVLAAKAKPSGDLLKIVRAAIEREGRTLEGKVAEGKSVGDSEQAERLALAQRATTLDESLESKQMEQEEMGERIGTVGSQIEKQKRLIELENESLAQTQKPAPDAQPAATTQAKQPAERVAEATGAAAVAKTAQKPAAGKAAEPKSKPAQKAKAAKPKAKAKPKPKAKAKPKSKKPRRVVPPPPPEEKGILATVQDIVGDYLMQAVAGVIALAGGLILLTYMRRRRQAEAEFEESILTDTGTTTEETATTDSGGQATTTSAGSTSFLSDFSQGGMGNISTDEVDPLAETEVYLAYGRDEQAEEILKDAVAKDPGRNELKVKLLEIYHQRNDVSAFETLAEELYAAFEGRGGELWNRVAEMGRRLNPDNPMFQVTMPAEEPRIPAAVPPAPAVGVEAFAPPEESEVPSGLDFEPAESATPAEAEAGLELDIAAEGVEAPADTGLEFDLEVETADTAAAQAERGKLGDTAELAAQDIGGPQVAEDEAVEPLGIGEPGEAVEFDTSERPADAEVAVAAEAPPAAAEAGEEVQWDLDAPSTEVTAEPAAEAALEMAADTGTTTEDSQQWDETATKLDLAKAYVDMGDAEGARSILDEVLAEGNEEQKKQAAELAAQIA